MPLTDAGCRSAQPGSKLQKGANGLGKMAREECLDAASRISRVLVFVGRPYRNTKHTDQALVIVEEGVPGVRVFLDIMVDLMPCESNFQSRRRALQPPIATAEARDHRTGTFEDRIDIVRQRAIVRGYCRIAVAGRQHDCKTACHAEADDPGLAGAILSALQPLPDGVDIIERRSLARRQIHHQGADATNAAAPGEQVWRYRKIPFPGQPIDMTTRHVGQAEDVMEHNNAGPWSLAFRRGYIAFKLVVWRRDQDLGRIVSHAIWPSGVSFERGSGHL